MTQRLELSGFFFLRISTDKYVSCNSCLDWDFFFQRRLLPNSLLFSSHILFEEKGNDEFFFFFLFSAHVFRRRMGTHRTISFDNTSAGGPSTWKLERKLNEKVTQWDEYYTRTGMTSEAWGTYFCTNTASGTDGIMKIWMQSVFHYTGWTISCGMHTYFHQMVPFFLGNIQLITKIVIARIAYEGSEFSSRARREAQATTNLGDYSRLELEALQKLTEKECPSASTLLNHKQERQSQETLVPGGHILYILMKYLPGDPLHDIYWRLPKEERQDI